MKIIQEYFKLKEHKIEPNDVYLGAPLSKMKLESGKYCWTMSPEQYLKAAFTNVEEELASSGNRFPSKFITQLLRNYAPWLEDSPETMADGVQRYQELIGQLIWSVEIIRLDILMETLLLSRYLVIPQVGTLSKHSISLDI